MTDETAETCGDHGGETENGEPCTRPPGWGREGAESGLCKAHNTGKDAKHERDKKRFLDELKSGAISFKKAAQSIGKSVPTIWRWRRDDEQFDEKVREAKELQGEIRRTRVEDVIFERIAAGEASASVTIFWLKNKAGWRDTKQLEHTGRDGGPIETEGVTEEEKQQIEDYTALFRENGDDDNDERI